MGTIVDIQRERERELLIARQKIGHNAKGGGGKKQ